MILENTLEDVHILAKAYSFALIKHGDQQYGNYPYIKHLIHVNEVAQRFELGEDIQVAAYLHDVLEDTSCTFEEIWREFGWQVAMLVFLVTDEPGSNRKERKEKTYPKTASNPKAILLKLCDRIANVEASLGNNPKMSMYKNEHTYFLDGLQISGTRYGKIGEMVGYLNSLFDEK